MPIQESNRVESVDAAMQLALSLAARGPIRDPNPRVGCVLLAPSSPGGGPRRILGRGFHRGAGTPHAEAAALDDARSAGVEVRGATAVVTLEPCSHTGRTASCADALLEAGVAEVVFAVADPNPVASGGAARLRSNGVRMLEGLRVAEGEALLRAWLTGVTEGRPFVTLKLASTLDGRVAAADGSSRWITSEAARLHAHQRRAEACAILVGTGTQRADDPTLSVRGPAAVHAPQPLRVVMGMRDVAADAAVRADPELFVHLRTHDPVTALEELHLLGARHVIVEGGPTISAAFLRAGLVDEIDAYLAPILLGDGASSVASLDVGRLRDANRWTTESVQPLGVDTLIHLVRDTRAHPQHVGAVAAEGVAA
ncbi:MULTISPECIES: bifunctional diaminohydroxyphosphoribosylaminopyrimidine deaminase/5-amino-6-(5-phosphoribosylamino)uracil reductase RibD [unclassified Pseudoclavibacter]|uniref:bifunctional diaminohydroxyphosphoribosylaminopyrimidine deaminase/5-amino-6-(5-phosphoribosylamino)uracil reductase RibD n=1 Tax=unclassified Pseudoclavibacter TaxID=2615177 RepID=UPI001BA6BA9F|nr:bifunctional diaminohydroxyphosphoribosylaminopyrimidine deaminase/5-amino-6-(5-phosphoribosylamino)uracil reductase RibD [Pseudoclavibacter sp. Marseille-Q4354]MBS3178675.1 bifunctional diaminohydroxyphosphoribosylaminopyrimidine deaminase/5-amino-6-(5-phosphoribosylamino)uracil reductase RibD [Pseudoclavibacter sp. Marseille-Q4354]